MIQRRVRAFTLVELLVALSGSLVVSLMMATVFSTTLRTIAVVASRTSVNGQLQVSVEQLARDVHQTGVRLETSCGTAPGPVYPFAQNVLILKVDLDPSVLGVDRVIYQNNAGVLERIVQNPACNLPNPPTRNLAFGVLQLEFDPWPWPAGNRFVETHLVIQNGAGSNPVQGKLFVRHNFHNPDPGP